MKKIVITIFLNLLITLCVIFILSLFSKNAYPTSGLYNLKRVEEKITLALKSTPEEKIDYYFYLLGERQKEIELVFSKRQYQHLLDTSLRYTTTAGNTTSIIKGTNNIKEAENLRRIFHGHEKNLHYYKDNLPPDTEEEKYVQDALNYIALYKEQLPN